MQSKGKLITVAIHTYEKAIILKTLFEKEGIETTIHNVNLIQPVISSGVRVRIHESDLPLALKIIEQSPILNSEIELKDAEHTHTEKPSILIPIDFSDYSYKACNIGFKFAEKLDCKVIMLNSYVSMNFSGSLPFDSDSYSSEITDVEETKDLEKVMQHKMYDFSKRINSDIENGIFQNVEFKTVVTEGIPEEAILEYAKQIKASLIVMGTRGKHKKEVELIGSVTAEVLDAGKFPVFTIPENISIDKIDDIKKIIFFTNICQDDLISFDTFARMFSKVKIDVALVPVLEKKISNVADREKAILNYYVSHYPDYTFRIDNISDKKFMDNLEKYVIEQQIDLIIIPNKKRNIFARLFNPSIAHKMLIHTDIPMLVIPI